MNVNERYVNVILPLKYSGSVTYVLPEEFSFCRAGSRVKVDFAGKEYIAVVEEILDGRELNVNQDLVYKPVIGIEELEQVSAGEIEFWKKIAGYYLITVGEVYKAAYSPASVRQERVKAKKSPEAFFKEMASEQSSEEKPSHGKEKRLSGAESALSGKTPELSSPQKIAKESIEEHFRKNPCRPVLLNGVTGSGKTEIYISLAIEQLQMGKNVLYMVPEIAISKQLETRLETIFGKRLLTFHSRQTAAEKRRIHGIVKHNGEQENNCAVVVLGTRSALFLPYSNLGLIIMDEEHDTSYKQTEPAPRYHAREASIMLSIIHKCNVLLGSATPSLETLYNCSVGRFSKVLLTEKFYGALQPEIEIIDTLWARKSRQMKGNFSQKLINLINRTLSAGEQVMIFRNRRSYAPVVECTECGAIPKCPHCNVVLSYHKYNNTLRCHCCDYTVHFSGICPECHSDSLKYLGAGTEKIEEEVRELFPQAKVARFDADTTRSKVMEEEIISSFSNGKIDILIGTQMISKGFDFEHLSLVAIIDADSILGIQDFRADEYAVQIFSQLMGRTGRREARGTVAIQTNQKNHPILRHINELQFSNINYISECDRISESLLKERAGYSFSPYVRMIKIIVKNRNEKRLTVQCETLKLALAAVESVGNMQITGPFAPVADKVRGEWLKCFYIKLRRDKELLKNKEVIKAVIDSLKMGNNIIIDVDPLG